VCVFQILNDGQRLRQAQTIHFKHGYQRVAIYLREALKELLAPRQMHGQVVVRQAFERKRDSYSE
jgi:hypothetical protein